MNDEKSVPENQTIVEFFGDLPYYVPIPENCGLQPTRVGAEKFILEFQHFKPIRHPDESHGDGVDDRLGTFIRSRVHILFYPRIVSTQVDKDSFVAKSLELTNQALLAVKDVAFDHTIRHLIRFDKFEIRILKIDKASGVVQSPAEFSHGQSFGPFGITSLASLSPDALERLQWVFSGLVPINPTRHLLLDAKYHNIVGDIPRSILDLATALEINIVNLITLHI